jgi:hypothetical protein
MRDTRKELRAIKRKISGKGVEWYQNHYIYVDRSRYRYMPLYSVFDL